MRTLAVLTHRIWRYLGGAGSLYPLDVNGEEYELTIPADYADMETAGTPYVLSIDPSTGLPSWRIFSGGTFPGTGFGTSFGTFGS